MTTSNTELYHHGVLGQKWGVRRYQNYDGSYTQAGVKRWKNSLDNYEKSDSRYRNAKKNNTDRTEYVNAKLSRKKAKRKLDKDYKHLKLDKLADKGKARYANGETITGHSNITSLLSGAGAVAAGSQYLAKSGIINQKLANQIAISSMAAVGASYVKRLVYDMPRDRQLRAYYSHTSKY